MTEADEEFKAKFVELVRTKKAEAGKTSSLMTVEKRERIVRCLQNPELEGNVRFRARVKERKFRLLQENDQVFLGVPDESSGETVYRRAACVEEFWDIITAAHVDNGHIGVVHTFNSIRSMYALLPRHVVSKYVHMCPVCSPTFRRSKLVMQSNVSGSATPVTFKTPQPIATVVKTDVSAGGPEGGGGDGDGGEDDAVMIASEEGSGGEEHMITVEQETADIPLTEAVVEGASPPVVAASSSSSSLLLTLTPVTPATPGQERVQVVVYTCHICDLSFDRKLLYQRHIRAHREHNPRIPFMMPYKSPSYKPTPVVEAAKRMKVERRTFTGRGRHLIIDGDMGVEACQALMLAAWRTDLTIVGVTCICGAVSTERACHNALVVLNACEREDVQVFCGAERPLIAKNTSSSDSLLGPSWQTRVDDTLIKPEHAVSAMIRMVSEQPGKISIVCLGPLTNLALALRLDPTLPRKLKDVFILGGNIEGRGNGSVSAEQNFYYDPEAACAVIEEIPNITLLPYEVCDRHRLPGDFFDSWVHLGTPRSEFVRGMGDENWVREKQENGYAPSCTYAMACVCDRSVALEKKKVYCGVELSGALCRGMMVVDWARRMAAEANVELVRSLDLGKIQSLLVAMVEHPQALELYTQG
ncbi:hypothetical protein ACOMHN_031834 [Nucella lapillus]